jgi:hypothetical protein
VTGLHWYAWTDELACSGPGAPLLVDAGRSPTEMAPAALSSLLREAAGSFHPILVGHVPTEQRADAQALSADLAGGVCGADLLLVSAVAMLWVEHAGDADGSAVCGGAERDRAAAALERAQAPARRCAGSAPARLEFPGPGGGTAPLWPMERT